MSELSLLDDQQLAIRLHDTMERHDRLIDSTAMGDERIYFANREVEAIKAEQQKRDYKPCSKCFDFGDATDGSDEVEGFCDCFMGDRLKLKVAAT
jgi:hypothetical protein